MSTRTHSASRGRNVGPGFSRPVSELTMNTTASNDQIAATLEHVADTLAEQGANRFREGAYRHAAYALRGLDEPVTTILKRDGLEGLIRLPGIGRAISRAIRSIAATGTFPLLDRMRGESDPVALMASIPGIGRVLAERIHTLLGIDALEDLEMAAHDGRLERIVGFGPKRLATIREALAMRLGRRPSNGLTGEPPTVRDLLEVDAEYLDRAASGDLRRIAPRRFNPIHSAWLPILHTMRGERHYTAMFSNTARAHRLGRTHDWVVIDVDGDHDDEQYTVVTARTGAMRGLRVVRGRESECAAYYNVSHLSRRSRRAYVTGRQPGIGRALDRPATPAKRWPEYAQGAPVYSSGPPRSPDNDHAPQRGDRSRATQLSVFGADTPSRVRSGTDRANEEHGLHAGS